MDLIKGDEPESNAFKKFILDDDDNNKFISFNVDLITEFLLNPVDRYNFYRTLCTIANVFYDKKNGFEYIKRKMEQCIQDTCKKTTFRLTTWDFSDKHSIYKKFRLICKRIMGMKYCYDCGFKKTHIYMCIVSQTPRCETCITRYWHYFTNIHCNCKKKYCVHRQLYCECSNATCKERKISAIVSCHENSKYDENTKKIKHLRLFLGCGILYAPFPKRAYYKRWKTATCDFVKDITCGHKDNATPSQKKKRKRQTKRRYSLHEGIESKLCPGFVHKRMKKNPKG